MSTYLPQEGVFPGRPPCASCGANFHLHALPPELVAMGFQVTATGLGAVHDRGGRLVCPEPYRPTTIEVAQRELAEAEAAGDEARVFVARGHLQRLQGRP
jgi:hypothetical protein